MTEWPSRAVSPVDLGSGLRFEILNVSSIEWTITPWTRSTLLHDRAIKWAKAKAHIYSDSICQAKMHEHAESNVKWKGQPQDFQQSNEYKDLFGIDGEPLEFEWNIFPRSYNIAESPTDARKMKAFQTSPEEFEDWIIFMSKCRITQQGSRLDIVHSSVQQKKTNCGERTCKSGVQWNEVAVLWWEISKKVDIRYFEVPVR